MDITTLTDVAARAIRHPADYVTAINEHVLFFERCVQESESVYSFYFSPKDNIQWHSGQHGIFTLDTKKSARDSKRIFSIASSTTERHIQIGTVISKKPSLFKTQLKALQPGDKIYMRGPIGEFHLPDKPAHIVGIAGGIGITPFRAIIKELVDSARSDIQLDLLYGCSPVARTFSAELNEWSKVPNVRVTYPRNKVDLRFKLSEVATTLGNTAHYYLSGSPGMIEELRHLLLKQGIKHIINDPFKGY